MMHYNVTCIVNIHIKNKKVQNTVIKLNIVGKPYFYSDDGNQVHYIELPL